MLNKYSKQFVFKFYPNKDTLSAWSYVNFNIEITDVILQYTYICKIKF